MKFGGKNQIFSPAQLKGSGGESSSEKLKTCLNHWARKLRSQDLAPGSVDHLGPEAYWSK